MTSKYFGMEPQSSKQWRAITYDYDLMSSYSDESRLYCLTDFQVAWIMSNLPYYNWITRWTNTNATQKDLNDQQNEMELALMSCLQLQPYMLEFNYEQAVELVLNNYETLYDSGGIPELNANTPTDFYSGDDSDERLDALCTAVSIYIKSYATNWISKAQVVLGITIVVSVGLSLTGVGGLIAGTILAGLALFTQTALDAMNDQSAIDNVICCMKDDLTALAITEANFQTSLDGCGFDVGSNEQIIVDIIKDDLDITQNWLSFLNSLGNSYVLAQIGVVDCPCVELTWDFLLGEGGALWSDNTFMITDGIIDVGSNVMIKSTESPANRVVINNVIGFFVDAEVDRVVVRYYQGQNHVNADFQIGSDPRGTFFTRDEESGHKVVDVPVSPPIDVGDSLWFLLDTGASDFIQLKSIHFYGTGINPYT